MEIQNDGGSFTVACYYFPNYHPGDSRNSVLKGPDWSEWVLMNNAKPRFEGHEQPRVPLWGYTDESDPKEMERKIETASEHGVNVFIFDWYYYNDGLFLEKALDKGFLGAANNDKIGFALMWANHNWEDIHPYAKDSPRKVLYPGKVTCETFDKICDHVIDKYFSHPSYWTLDGRPYFSIYDVGTFIKSFGSVEMSRKALDEFREKAELAGLPGIHLNVVAMDHAILAGDTPIDDLTTTVDALGFDSVTSYVWIHHVALPALQTDYRYVHHKYLDYWDFAAKTFRVPYFPNVTMGWDSSPRARQEDEFGNSGYPFTNIITDNYPDRFEEALLAVKNRMRKKSAPRIITINSWNEWTEGSYIEPDTPNGLEYLKAVKRVFG